MIASGISFLTIGSNSYAGRPSWVIWLVQSKAIISAPASHTALAASKVGVINTSVSSCQIFQSPITGKSTSFLIALICSGSLARIPTAPPHWAAFAIFTTKSTEKVGSSCCTWQDTISPPLNESKSSFLFVFIFFFVTSFSLKARRRLFRRHFWILL